MFKVVIANTNEEIAAVDKLFKEYSEWCKQEFIRTGLVSHNAPELNLFNNEKLPGEYRPPNGCLMLAYFDNDPVGCMFFHRLQNRVCELKRFYINPKGRGKGLAVKMLDEFCRYVKEKGYIRLRISSHNFMSKAIEIYKQYGFYEISNYVEDRLQAGDIQMELNLESLNI